MNYNGWNAIKTSNIKPNQTYNWVIVQLTDFDEARIHSLLEGVICEEYYRQSQYIKKPYYDIVRPAIVK